MGYEIARAAAYRGANVTLVTGPTSLPIPANVIAIKVTSAADMYDAVTKNAPNQDAIILSAAVADYTPSEVADHKIKKKDGDMSIPLSRTKDILGTLGEAKLKAGSKKPYLCGFSMETENLLENSRAKLTKKNVDMICANSLRTEGAGFGVDTNVLTLITANDTTELPLQSKDSAAHAILDKALTLQST
jgi:phosphopantothenoylcysteine decarboxylase/phosphopantothenate--cysteine ligase